MPAQLPPPLDPAEAEEWMYQGVNAHMIEKFGPDWQEEFQAVAVALSEEFTRISDELDRALDDWFANSAPLEVVASKQADHADFSTPREREWRLNSPPPGSRLPFCEGDRFIKIDGVPGVAVYRVITDAEFYALMMDAADRLHLTSDSHRSGSAPRRHLEVVR